MVKTVPPSTTGPGANRPLLERILHEAWEFSQAKRPFLAVFDLDSTLFDLTLRVSSIVDEFALDPASVARFPRECEALKKVQILSTDWGLDEPLSRIGITKATSPDFMHALHECWAAGFFSNDFLIYDEPLPGAVEYVQELHQLGAHIMYLTGRDIPRMEVGTAKSLRDRGFPMDAETVQMILKPVAELDDAHFKLEVLQKAEETYERIWLFENEPVNLNLVAKHCPEIGLVFIDSVHSGREEVDATLDSIRHFEVDLAEFRKIR